MRQPTDFTKRGYIGCVWDKREARTWQAFFSAAGIATVLRRYKRPYAYLSSVEPWTLYCANPKEVFRARELKRGFRTAMQLRGDPRDFLIGFRAGLRAKFPRTKFMAAGIIGRKAIAA